MRGKNELLTDSEPILSHILRQIIVPMFKFFNLLNATDSASSVVNTNNILFGRNTLFRIITHELQERIITFVLEKKFTEVLEKWIRFVLGEGMGYLSTYISANIDRA